MSNLTLAPSGQDGSGSGGGYARQTARQKAATAALEADGAPPVDPGQRLMIEEIEAGHFVYTVVDRASGTVVAQTPREEVTQMSLRANYTAGNLIRVKA